MLEWLCILFLFVSWLTWSRRDYRQERILAEQAEIRARMALLLLTLEEEERAYQRVLKEHR
uniref:Uncharacterized protein n=1 Tax=viral metagenome TaxID=1070528 RepID=A0A6M3LVP5_9ZZZZ